MEPIHTRIGEYPDEAWVDGGFASQAEVEKCAEKPVTIYAPVSKPKDDTRDPHQPLPKDCAAVAAWRQRRGTDEAKAIDKERAATAECVNAIARNRGCDSLPCAVWRKPKRSYGGLRSRIM